MFITGLEQGLFPHEQAISEDGGIEEERRLMYVAITRARRRLYLTHAQSRMLHGQVRYGLPSSFLEEVPQELVHSLSRRAAPAYSAPRVSEPAAHYSPPAPARRNADVPFKVGSRVRHPKYGEGVVSSYQGQGPDTEIRVNFAKLGEKAFILDYARLEAA